VSYSHSCNGVTTRSPQRPVFITPSRSGVYGLLLSRDEHEADGIAGGTPETGSLARQLARGVDDPSGIHLPLFARESDDLCRKAASVVAPDATPRTRCSLICLLRRRVLMIVGIGMAIRLTIAWVASVSFRDVLRSDRRSGPYTRYVVNVFNLIRDCGCRTSLEPCIVYRGCVPGISVRAFIF